MSECQNALTIYQDEHSVYAAAEAAHTNNKKKIEM